MWTYWNKRTTCLNIPKLKEERSCNVRTSQGYQDNKSQVHVSYRQWIHFSYLYTRIISNKIVILHPSTNRIYNWFVLTYNSKKNELTLCEPYFLFFVTIVTQRSKTHCLKATIHFGDGFQALFCFGKMLFSAWTDTLSSDFGFLKYILAICILLCCFGYLFNLHNIKSLTLLVYNICF